MKKNEISEIQKEATDKVIALQKMQEVNWENLPVDTLILCTDSIKDFSSGVGNKRYFSKALISCSGIGIKVFQNGRTSKTSEENGTYICEYAAIISKEVENV